MTIFRSLFVFLILMILVSCKTNTEKPPKTEEGSYFSIRSYAADQWKIFHDQPFGIVKVMTLNGKTDSVFTNVDHVKWGDVFKLFFDTDISGKKFDDQYNFTSFRDEMSLSDNFIYEAKNKKLFTRKVNITTNIYSHKITSVYIETEKQTQWGEHTQKLFYVPVKTIIIQEFESSLSGDHKDLKVEYRFL